MMCAAMTRLCAVSPEKPGEFDKLRKFYEERREWSSLRVICDDPATAEMLKKLGFTTQPG